MRTQFDTVLSLVYPMGKRSVALGYIEAADSARGRACITRYLASEKTHSISSSQSPGEGSISEPAFTQVKVTALLSPLSGVPIYGIRTITATAALRLFGGPPHYAQHDLLAFVVGPGLVMLKVEGEPRPFPMATEQRLISLLYRRAEADAL